MNILFLLSIEQSFGERQHAMAFARQAAAAGHDVVFLVPTAIAPYFRSAALPTLSAAGEAQLLQALEDAAPDLVLCCEYYNQPPLIRARLPKLGVPFASMDGTTMGVEINTNPITGLGPRRGWCLAEPESLIRLRPCPVNSLAADDARTLHWNAFPDAHRRQLPLNLRARLALHPEQRVVLLAIAPWASQAAARLGRPDYYPAFLRLVRRALAATGAPLHLVVVSDLPIGRERMGSCEVTFVNLLAHADFEDLLLGSSLVITDNAIQTSLSKALVAGIPGLAIVHSHANRAGPLPYAYNIFPLTLRLPPANDFLRAIDVAEITEPDAVAAQVARLLAGPETAAVRSYREAVLRLPTAGAVIHALSRRLDAIASTA